MRTSHGENQTVGKQLRCLWLEGTGFGVWIGCSGCCRLSRVVPSVPSVAGRTGVKSLTTI